MYELGGDPDIPFDGHEIPEEALPFANETDDPYESTGIIPPQDTPVEHQIDTAGQEIAPDIPKAADPRKFKQIHFIDGGWVKGKHPDAAVRKGIAQERKDMADEWRARQEILDTIPTYNAAYRHEISTARRLLQRDFGKIPAAAPVRIVDCQEARSIGLLKPNASGTVANGHLVIGVNPEVEDLWSSEVVFGTLLHEGAHRRAAEKLYIATAPYAETYDAEGNLSGPIRYHMLINSDQDFITVQARENGLFYGGCFIEEGFVDSYRVRGAQEIYGARKLKFIERMTPGDDHLQLAYTDRATNDPRYSVQEGCIYIPWKYMKSTAPYKGRGLAMKNSISELAAYGIDLLDARLPGLHDEMKRSHADPMLKRDIAERINSIKPGLYAELLSLDYIGKDFYRGLATIHEALGYAR